MNLYEWLIKTVATKFRGENILSLYHPFNTNMNEGINNAVLRRCPKNNVFAGGSGGLKYRVALVARQQTQGATKYKNDLYQRCGIGMSQLQESFWNNGAAYKAQFNWKRK